MKIRTLIIGSLALLLGCSAGKEAVLPLRNMMYTGARIFPIRNNETNFSFRVWISNSTSIDRIVTVSSDSVTGNICNLIALGHLYRKGMFGEKKKDFYSKSEIAPKSGFDRFIV